MPKTKENKGITLIALVITIIVLLILAGVTISAISGNDSTPAKAQEATQKTDISTAKEDCILTATTAKTDAFHATYVTNSANKTIAQSVIDALLAKNNTKVNSALIEVANNGTVTISTAGYEVIGTVDENGTLTFGEVGPLVPGIKDVPETLNMDTGTIQTITATLKGISGTITWTSSDDDIATVENGVITTANTLTVNGQPVNSATVTITATLGDYSESCTVTVTKPMSKWDKINSQIGQTITYPTLGGATGWKIFYADNEGMFIIPTNIISRTNASAKDSLNKGIPLSSKTVKAVMGSGTYGGKWNSTWLNNPSGVVTSQDRHKAVAYLCDKTNWEAYVAKTAGENPTNKIAKSYAVGAPTLELFVASWNIAASSTKRVSLPLETTTDGYNQTISSGITTSEANAVYNPTGSGYYWLAAPYQLGGSNYSLRVRYVRCSSGYEYVDDNDHSNTRIGYRPLVSIPLSNVNVANGAEAGTFTISIKDDNGNAIQ